MGTNGMSLKRAAEMCAQEFTVHYADGTEETIFVRTRTQTEIEAAMEAITPKRLAVKERYKPGEPAYESAIIDLQQVDERTLVSFAAAGDLDELGRKAARELPTLLPFSPTGYPNAAARAKAEDAHEKLRAEQEGKWRKRVAELTAEREAELAKLPRTELIEAAARPFVANLIEAELTALEHAHLMMDCVRDGADHSKPYFSSLDEVPAPGSVRAYLIAAITAVDKVRPIDIKNSQGNSVLPSGVAGLTPGPTKGPSTTNSPGSVSPKTKRRGGRKRSSTD